MYTACSPGTLHLNNDSMLLYNVCAKT